MVSLEAVPGKDKDAKLAGKAVGNRLD